MNYLLLFTISLDLTFFISLSPRKKKETQVEFPEILRTSLGFSILSIDFHGFGSGKALHRRGFMGDNGGEAEGVLRELRRGGSDCGYEGKVHRKT